MLYLFASSCKVPRVGAIGDPFTRNQGKPILQARNVVGRAHWVFPAVQLCVPYCAFWTKLCAHFCAPAFVHFGLNCAHTIARLLLCILEPHIVFDLIHLLSAWLGYLPGIGMYQTLFCIVHQQVVIMVMGRVA